MNSCSHSRKETPVGHKSSVSSMSHIYLNAKQSHLESFQNSVVFFNNLRPVNSPTAL